MSCKRLQKKFNDCNVHYVECNLRDYNLPFDDEEFDAVIMCEVLEHLNFNPLPVIKEINRVLKQGGLLYLSLPNIARLYNRESLLMGKSIHNPLKDFFGQLDPNDNLIVGLHWREYTTDEIKEMLEQLDFELVKQEYYQDPESTTSKKSPKKIIRNLIRQIIGYESIRKLIIRCLFGKDHDPTLKETQVSYAVKMKMCSREFHYTDATIPIP